MLMSCTTENEIDEMYQTFVDVLDEQYIKTKQVMKPHDIGFTI